MCDHVEYLKIDCGNAHCTIEQRRLQYTGVVQGDTEIYDNLNCVVVRGIQKSTDLEHFQLLELDRIQTDFKI